jgi:hypothetical protein
MTPDQAKRLEEIKYLLDLNGELRTASCRFLLSLIDKQAREIRRLERVVDKLEADARLSHVSRYIKGELP